eukprot:1192232-Prorocentrum_minimum.AAC.6
MLTGVLPPELAAVGSAMRLDSGTMCACDADVKGYCVDVKGYDADVKGYCVDVKGYNADVKGYCVDVKGCDADVKGDCVDVKGYRNDWSSSTYSVDVKGYDADVKGYCVDVKGYDADVKDVAPFGQGGPISVCAVFTKAARRVRSLGLRGGGSGRLSLITVGCVRASLRNRWEEASPPDRVGAETETSVPRSTPSLAAHTCWIRAQIHLWEPVVRGQANAELQNPLRHLPGAAC